MAMTTGFVFISTGAIPDRLIYDELSKINEITELYTLVGQFDMMAKINTKDFEAMRGIVIDKIRRIKGVVDTKTLTGI